MLPPGSWFAKQNLGLYLVTGTKRSTPCHFASYILSFGVKLINGLPVHYSFYPGFLAGEFFFWDRPFPFLIFFSSEFISWFLACSKNAISGLCEIFVIICGSSFPFFPVLWDWDIKSKCSKLLLLLCWDCLTFQTLMMNYLPWAIITVHRSYTSCPWFSSFHTLWLTEWTWEHLCFPGCRNLDEVTQPHLRASMGQCLICSFHWHSGIQEGLRLVVQSKLWHTLGRVHTWAAVCSCSWALRLDVAAKP